MKFSKLRSSFLGSWTVKNVTPNEEGESRKVKVKVRVNPNGIFSVCSASMFDTVTVPQIEEVSSNFRIYFSVFRCLSCISGE